MKPKKRVVHKIDEATFYYGVTRCGEVFYEEGTFIAKPYWGNVTCKRCLSKKGKK